MEEKLDIVVPYVDSTDKAWQELFYKNSPKTVDTAKNGKERFRGQGDFFRFFFRGLELNKEYINNIYLLVCTESQVPDWLDKTKIKVITHNQFIPEEYLPTFNSCTIEMFLDRIPGLGERFLYLNDDFYILKKLKYTDFFDKNKIKETFKTNHLASLYGKHCENCANTIYEGKIFKRCDHELKPYIKEKYTECFNLYEAKIKASISKFRQPNNFNCYLYSLYLDKLGLVTKTGLTYGYITNYNEKELARSDAICINDTSETTSVYSNPFLITWFNNHFKKTSSFELTSLPSNFVPNCLPKQAKKFKPDNYLYF